MRLFVAIRLPKEMIPAVERAAAPLDGALGARVLPRESYHLTLKFLGETPNERLEEIKQALSKIKFQPFDVHLSGAGAFPSKGIPRAIWIGGESQGAGELAQKIEEALFFLGLPKEHFSVHLTVARSKGVADMEDFLKTGEVGTFGVRSFCLMKSSLTPAGALYEVLKEFAAQG
ncbi:TPA: RNA 2',3'-cyclic phosphodiesterase [Candidatus Micrarchaeota archaeon]|nr:RNA 2',3'-cyclic phosphodiesterase [Candidatus Micrarchaeota archaeon]HIH30038.1 RNA 2',3'-cyclic phosphodiesterase [Candidatus Micrarchaeota archaeon]